MNFRIALAQIDPVLGDLGKNVTLHVRAAQRALEMGATFVVFPELSLTGYSIKDMNLGLAMRTSDPPRVLDPLIELSNRISILAGGIEEDASYRIFNSAFLFEQGMVRTAHRKIYPPTYGMFEELRYFSPGDSLEVARTRNGLIGVLICEDLWHLPLPYLLAQQGAQVLIALVASPTRVTGSAPHLHIAKANRENHSTFARLLSSYVVFCNRVGFEDGLNFWGASSVTGPDGSVIAECKQFEEDTVVCEISDAEVRRARQSSRHFLDDDPHFFLRELKKIVRETPEPPGGL